MIGQKIDWKKAWDDPSQIIKLINQNNEGFIELHKNKRKILTKLKSKEKIKGFVVEGERKHKLIEEMSNIDPQLARELIQKSNVEEITQAIEKRIANLAKDIAEAEKLFEEHEKTIEEGGKIVKRHIEIFEELRNLESKRAKNIMLNKKYEYMLSEAVLKNTIQQKINFFEKEAKESHKRSKESSLIQEKIIILTKEIAELKTKAPEIQKKFQKETEDIFKLLEETPFLKEEKKKEEHLLKRDLVYQPA
jgi:hypothetical protein